MSNPEVPPFILQSRVEGGVRAIYCHDCVAEWQKRGLDLKRLHPLAHPPIKISTKPKFSRETVKLNGENQEVGKWHWDEVPYCLKHAKKRIKKMRLEDIDPTR